MTPSGCGGAGERPAHCHPCRGQEARLTQKGHRARAPNDINQEGFMEVVTFNQGPWRMGRILSAVIWTGGHASWGNNRGKGQRWESKFRQLRVLANGMPCSQQDPRVSLATPRTCSLIFSELYYLPPQSPSAFKKKLRWGNSLAVLWLGLSIFTAGLISGWGIKILQATQHGQK